MNHRNFFGLLIFALLLSACKKKDKDDDMCIQTDFVADNLGTNVCDGENPEDVTVSIKEKGDKLFLVDDVQDEYPLETDGFNISILSIDLFFAEVSGTEI